MASVSSDSTQHGLSDIIFFKEPKSTFFEKKRGQLKVKRKSDRRKRCVLLFFDFFTGFFKEPKSKTNTQNDLTNNEGKFELGVEFGVFRTDIGYELYYKTLSRNIQISGLTLHHSMMNGVIATRQVSPKWWLQTGIRYGRSTWSNDLIFDAAYDKSQEQIQPNGEVFYDFTLVGEGRMSDFEMEINTSVNNASSLDNDDWIVSSFLLEKQMDWIQIPIGVVYRLGEKRLNYEIKGGLSLNQITINNYQLEGLIEGTNALFVINEISNPERYSKQFLEGYLGFGIRYNLREKIIIHTNFNLRYAPSIQVFENDVFTGVHFGVSYIF